MLVFRGGVRFFIWCILDHGLCHLLVELRFPVDRDFIWLGWIDNKIHGRSLIAQLGLCCRRVCLQRFTRELKRPNQRQGAFLRHLKCRNHPGTKVQSFSTQKVGFSKWCLFFDSMHFRPWPLPSGGFIQKNPCGQGFHLTRVNWLYRRYSLRAGRFFFV